ncbi:hypothetical protein BH11BAC2_BH11BAC2_22440 [soil metagenome]
MIPYISPITGNPLITEGNLLINDQGESYPIIKEIPRFVTEDNYAAAFGHQWKTFANIQIDSKNGTSITRERVERCLGFPISDLKGKTLLEVGCGAGRFTELLVEGLALVHAIDLSVAVEVNKEIVGEKFNYQVAQASVYEIPYPAASFDIVFCLGVIQHTPNTEKTIESLWNMVKPGGIMVIDHYIWRIGYYSTLTPLYRGWLKRLKPQKSMPIVKNLVNFFFPIHWKLKDKGIINWLAHRISPLIVYIKEFPEKDYKFHYDLSQLDTYDQLTDYYKHLRTPNQIRKTLEDLGATNIWINKGGNGIEARCSKIK